MIISILRMLGKAELEEQSELDVILDEYDSLLERNKNLICCNIDFMDNSFELEIEEYSRFKLPKILPSKTGGSSKHFSPFLPVNTTLISKTQFSELEQKIQSKFLNFTKISGFEDFKELLQDDIPFRFGLWLNEYKNTLAEKMYTYYQKNELEFSENKEKVKRTAPKFLTFKFKIDGEFKFPGEIDSFRELYSILKNESIKDFITSSKEKRSCIACGQLKENLMSLQACKFFEFFSLDQKMFQFGFQEKSDQALICKSCEVYLMKGYQLFNEVLQFEAYRIQKTMTKSEIIYHSILPLTNSEKNTKDFISAMKDFRENYYYEERNRFRKQIESLNNSLSRFDRTKRKQKEKELVKLKKSLELLESEGSLRGSKRTGIEKILEEVSKQKIGLLDVYYKEESTAGSSKKVIQDFFMGDKNTINNIVVNLHKTSREISEKIIFDYFPLFTVFGEKTGRLIIQSLFNGNKLYYKDFYRAAYKKLWSTFRGHIKTTSDSQKLSFKIINGINLFHFTYLLLSKMELLR